MIDLKEYGFKDSCRLDDGLMPARVIAIRKELYGIVCSRGETAAKLGGSFYYKAGERSDFPAVGDFVAIHFNPDGQSRIVKVLPRTAKFSRTDFSGHAVGYAKTILEQVVAANFDTVFILSSLNQDFNPSRIARYLTLARQSGGTPVVILSKADLCADCAAFLSMLDKIADGVAVIPLSSKTGMGLDRLAEYLQPGKTIVFLGMSGVGKSSLFNALAGRDVMTVKAIRADDARGRHTTTHRELVLLPNGTMVIDTPGMRELGLWDAEQGIGSAFADVAALIAACRFSDCTHTSEPGCAVRAALADKALAQDRWQAYRTQMNEVRFVTDRSRRPKRRV